MMSLQSSNQDSSREDEKAKEDDRPSSSTSKPVRGQSRRRTQQRLIEESTPPQQMEASSGRRLPDQLGQSTRKGIAFLGDTVSRHNCSRFSVSRLHRKRWFARKEIEPRMKTLHALARSQDSSKECMAITAAAEHTERLRETARGANPRYQDRQP